MNETIILSRIYSSLLSDFEAMSDIRIRDPQRSRMIEMISESVHSALRVMSSRCPKCDSKDITVICGGCAREALKQLNQMERDNHANIGRGTRASNL